MEMFVNVKWRQEMKVHKFLKMLMEMFVNVKWRQEMIVHKFLKITN